ncbi:MAG: threonine transporter RhtB [Gammaproteobacteria bacterium]|nr:MAG: threonine transporter RhtB [Gammaproteobacteria bacterium]
MLNYTLLAAFVPTFLFVSITPGMCMMLAMTMGMTIGFKRSLFMMLGELVGVGLVAGASVIGVAAMMLRYPEFFVVLKYGGGAYLAYLGVNLWLSRGKMAIDLTEENSAPAALALMSQGFITAIANPKGWAFFIALLPPFIDIDKTLAPQLSLLVSMILVLEFGCLCLYSAGGNVMRRFLQRAENVRLLNRLAGTMMLGVALWLAMG